VLSVALAVSLGGRPGGACEVVVRGGNRTARRASQWWTVERH
jgi:hypothetical protein